MDHITSGHTAGGSRAKQSGGKTIFPSNMSESQIEKTVREAYKNGSKVQTQGDRVLVRGEANGVQVEMWVNTKTNTIETAYPIN
nr:EndoU domain-containing protein [Paenibacillus sp. MMS18-CY102]